jgi:hypothetical protein
LFLQPNFSLVAEVIERAVPSSGQLRGSHRAKA